MLSRYFGDVHVSINMAAKEYNAKTMPALDLKLIELITLSGVIWH